MTQNLPTFGEYINESVVAPSLRIETKDISQLISGSLSRVKVASTGLVEIFVPVVSEEVL